MSEPKDKGPWKARIYNQTRVAIESDDFTHDVSLRLDGDFSDEHEALAYGAWVAEVLNRASSERSGQ